MNNRWHMNRMGFVNFWLYDEETFSFSDGKLLLRGQNGSGKSITTQSFIPFILDGDRTPSRLDPFGSSDRKMDYYFLGESGKDESTGYLFLEFKKENTEQYRTIGIGQRAQRGKPMTFWGFVVLDGKRIGYDISLYKSVGDKKIPYTKKELKGVIGESNPFTETQREYMELVNKYIFGFTDIHQYSQFIKLLIKVRAPKLSKEFKPTKVYEILNDSLQTLSDEDMRAMVDAMEKMDEIQNSLDSLNSSFKDTQSIQREYDRYNIFMLGKKAKAYTEQKSKVDIEKGSLNKKETEEKNARDEIKRRELEAEKLEDERSLLTKEREVIDAEDLESSVEKLKDAQMQNEAAVKEREDAENKIEKNREDILRCDAELRESQGKLESFDREVKRITLELEEENDILQLEVNEKIGKGEFKQVKGILDNLEIIVSEGLDALKENNRLEKNWSEEAEKLQGRKMEQENAESQFQYSKAVEDECRDSVIEQLYVLQSKNTEVKISETDLKRMIDSVSVYKEPSDVSKVQRIYENIWRPKYNEFSEKRMKYGIERDSLILEKQKLEAELKDIEAMEMPVPKQSLRVQEARKKLREKGIPFIPFYEAVEFGESVSGEVKDRIECQLQDAGILDALIVPEKEYYRFFSELKELSDAVIHPDNKVSGEFSELVPAEINKTLQNETSRVLKCISKNRDVSAELVLGDDGYFRSGLLEGYSHASQEASYVGAAARKRTKEKMILNKKAEIDTAIEKLADLEKIIKELDGRISVLLAESENFPLFDDINQAMDIVREASVKLEICIEKYSEQEGITTLAEQLYNSAKQKVIRICSPMPYRRKQENYEEVLGNLKDYRSGLTELELTLTNRNFEKMNYAHIEEIIQKIEDLAESHYDSQRRAIRTIQETEKQIERIDSFLNNPQIKEMAERLKRIARRLSEIGDEYQKNRESLAVLKNDAVRWISEIEEMKSRVQEDADRENKLLECFREELSLRLVFKEGESADYRTAVKAQELVRESDRQREVQEVYTSLLDNFHAHRSSLISYGISMEHCFENGEAGMLRSRYRIYCVWNGQKLYLDDFFTVLKESIENTELLIRQKDRELFEGILADTLSRKLSGRIKESRRWIRDMSALMKDMDTSMALTFSLDWKPKSGQGENELDTQELENILSREKGLLSDRDIEKASSHFRKKIKDAKLIAEENGEDTNYMDMVRDALDYRKWFEFRMNYYMNNENKRELTNGAFNRLSGGEKAMAMYVPLFAAVNAQYRKADNKDHPRIIALDESFAGVDDKNISSMFELVHKLKFDYIMNSQMLWGCYETVKSLRIAELLRPANSDIVTVIYYHWNGRERILDDQ